MAVYFVRAVESDKVKIGFTANKDPQGRLSSISTGCPDELEILHVLPDATREDEKKFHETFWRSHVRREWFRYRPEISDYLGDYGIPKPIKEVKSHECVGMADTIQLIRHRLLEGWMHTHELSYDRMWRLWYEMKLAIMEGEESLRDFVSSVRSEVHLDIPPDDFEIEMMAHFREKRQRELKESRRVRFLQC